MNRDIKLILQCVVVLGLVVFAVNRCAHASDFDIVQHLYDQAIYEITEGDRYKGCQVLHEAFAHSTSLNDDWKTYNQIWAVGNKVCGWTLNPDTMEAVN